MLAVVVLLGIIFKGDAVQGAYSEEYDAYHKGADTYPPFKEAYPPMNEDPYIPPSSTKYPPGDIDEHYGYPNTPRDKTTSYGSLPLDAVPMEKFILPANRVCKDKRGTCKGPCREGFHCFNNVCYKYIYRKMDFASAELFCQQEFCGHLASIHCRLNHLFVADIVRESYFDCPQTWIGLTDCNKEGYFLWTDGTKLDHTAWCKGEPSDLNGSQNCIVLDRNSHFLWADEDCSKDLNFVCAYVLPCQEKCGN